MVAELLVLKFLLVSDFRWGPLRGCSFFGLEIFTSVTFSMGSPLWLLNLWSWNFYKCLIQLLPSRNQFFNNKVHSVNIPNLESFAWGAKTIPKSLKIVQGNMCQTVFVIPLPSLVLEKVLQISSKLFNRCKACSWAYMQLSHVCHSHHLQSMIWFF